MIYEYPEEFVVPVVYTEELKENPMYREWELKYLQMEKVVEPYKKMKEYEMLPEDEYENETFYKNNIGKKGMNYLEFDDEESQEKPYEEDMCNDNMEYEHMKNILKDIDNEYAKCETLGM
ncbi:hypothetical protein [Clostridium sp.]|jgi:hypothetical protein|uniref:hypothetical protein n=1 Tax=Clostridium sp. TaxID=1506 RepID=UPI00284D23AF|nr:hypothetical protein [Clostridium sp.]MDR3593166.1 hypothetical protein [Clostridium sp.]